MKVRADPDRNHVFVNLAADTYPGIESIGSNIGESIIHIDFDL